MIYKPLKKKFYARDTVIVAQELLGKMLVRVVEGKCLVGIISETEAYRSDDPASHSYKGRTERNKSMFGLIGHAYVYLSYGIHYCLNAVARDVNSFPAGGVLIRSVIPVCGLDQIKTNRKMLSLKNLTNGPGKLTEAFHITKIHDGINLMDIDSELFIAEGYEVSKHSIKATKRVGISVAQDKLWRFIIKPEYTDQIFANI